MIVGAGPTGITAATLLAQYGIDCLVLDRWPDVYPQPRAVHLDDEIYRIVARLGIADEFAAISRPAHGLRLLDHDHAGACRVPPRPRAQRRTASRRPTCSTNPNSRRCCAPTSSATRTPNLRGDAEVTGITDDGGGRSGSTFTDRTDGREHVVEADYVLGCDGANSVVRAAIGASHAGPELRAALAGRRRGHRRRPRPVGRRTPGVRSRFAPAPTCASVTTRYRWEFRLLPGETADDFADA